MIIRILISLLIALVIILPAFVISWPIVAILLLTKWDGKTTMFGNTKWGRANDHPINPTKGYWQEWKWLCIRNPVNNLMTKYLSAPTKDVFVKGSTSIGNHLAGGFYQAKMGIFWEYYLIYPYGKRCIRVRIGWKIMNSDKPAAYCFVVNPVMSYSGS